MAQDVRISANTTASSVLAVTNTATSDTTSPAMGKPAIYGISQPTYYRGIGVEGVGSSRGVYGVANGTSPAGSSNTRIGVAGYATGGNSNYGIYGSVSGSTDYAGYFVGNVITTGSYQNLSDSNLKTNIKPMAPALTKLMDLKPKSYEMDPSKLPNTPLASGPQFGVLAQDVAKVFPELVATSPILSGDPSSTNTKVTQYESVNYSGLIPVLIKAVQEQQAEIKSLQQQIRVLKAQ